MKSGCWRVLSRRASPGDDRAARRARIGSRRTCQQIREQNVRNLT